MVQSLFAFGSNGNGQLGIGSDEDTSIPQLVKFIPNLESPEYSENANSNLIQPPFHDFAAGGNHTVLITKEDQNLYMTGSNKDGELLLNEPVQEFTLFSVPSDLLSSDSRRLRWRSVACGWAFTIAVTQPEKHITSDTSLTTGETTYLNKAYAWGSGSFGELGLGPSLTKTGRNPTPIEKGLLGINTLYSSGTSKALPPTQIEILKVRAGLRHVLILVKEVFNPGQDHESKSKIALYGWGSNRQGQLGQLERTSDPSQPYTEKELRGKFMEPTRIIIFNDRGSVEDVPEIVDMTCGQNHSLVLFSDGTVYSSGLNKYGQLGPSSTPDQSAKDFRIGFEKVHGLPFVDSISCGWNHNAAMNKSSNNGRASLYLWGRNDHGQLGSDIPASEDIAYPGVVKVQLPILGNDHKSDQCGGLEEIISYSCGSEHTLVMTQSGDSHAWGWNEHGNCSRGMSETDDRQNVRIPRKVKFPSSVSTKGRSCHGWVYGGYGSSWVWT